MTPEVPLDGTPAPDRPRRSVAVLGVHRSGTSLTARTLNLLGVSLGDVHALIPAGGSNPAGYWENEPVTRVSDAVLAHFGGSWDVPPQLPVGWEEDPALLDLRAQAGRCLAALQAAEPDAPWYGFKDPRVSLLLPFWSHAHRIDRYVLAIRDPREVAGSLAKRDAIDEEWSAYLWLRYTAAVLRHAHNPLVVDYGDYFSDPEQVVDRLVGHLGLPVSDDQRGAALGNVQAEMRHNVVAWEITGPLAAVAQRAYDDLRTGASLAQALVNEYGTGLLSSAHDEQITPGRVVQTDLERVRRSVAGSRAEKGRWEERSRKLETALQAAERKTAEREEAAARRDEAVRRAAAALESRLATIAAQLEETSGQLAAARADHRKSSADVAELRGQVADAIRRYRAAEERIRQIDKRWQKLLSSKRFQVGDIMGDALSRVRRIRSTTIAEQISGLLADDALATARPAPAAASAPLSAPAPRVVDAGVVLSRPKPSVDDVVVYTAVAGGYDDLKTPQVLPQGWQLVAFSDTPAPPGSPWVHRPFDYFHISPTRMARYVKVHPHVYFPDVEWSIWIDANLLVRGDLSVFLERLAAAEAPIGSFLHPHRADVYEEADEVVKRGLSDKATAREQVERYRGDGLRPGGGLYETNVLVRRHRDPRVVRLMNRWWREIDNGSHRDQLSLPWACEQVGLAIAALAPRGESVRNSPLLSRFQHGHTRTPA